MRNPFRRATDNERIAQSWATATADLEQYVEALPVVTPEVTDALNNSRSKWQKWQRIADQGGSNNDGN